jgi:high affinity Mn2+ porin
MESSRRRESRSDRSIVVLEKLASRQKKAALQDHREYLAAGGLGAFLGDGRLSYGREAIAEAYYSLQAYRGAHVSVDYQRIWNPSYNFDRHGPVNILSARFQVEF